MPPSVRRLSAAALLACALAAPAAAEPFSAEQKSALEALVRDYILRHPEIILESVAGMEARQKAGKDAAAAAALVEHRQALERNAADPVLGNPDGDVTIVEFFDYQ